MIPKAWDFAVTSCLRPATRNPVPTATSTQDPAATETLKRTFHDNSPPMSPEQHPLHPSGFGHARGWGDPARNLFTWISQRHSASPRRFTVTPRVPSILRRVRLAASRDAPLGPDDWWPARDDPDPDSWSTDYDSLAER